MAGTLQPAHQHQALQMADVEAVGGGVEAEIAGHRPGSEGAREAIPVGGLVDETAGFEGGEQVLRGAVHGVSCGWTVPGRPGEVALTEPP